MEDRARRSDEATKRRNDEGDRDRLELEDSFRARQGISVILAFTQHVVASAYLVRLSYAWLVRQSIAAMLRSVASMCRCVLVSLSIIHASST